MKKRIVFFVLLAAVFLFSLAACEKGGDVYVFYDLGYDGLLKAEKLEEGDTLSRPENPKREGYRFVDWTTTYEGGETFVFGGTPKESLTIYAKWEKKTTPEVPQERHVCVFFDLGYDDLFIVRQIEKNSVLTAPKDPERAGFEFVGWFANKACTVSYAFGQEVASETTIYAKFRDIENVFSANYFAALGLYAEIPENSENDVYSIIGGEIAQVEFDFGEARFRMRAGKNIEWRELANINEPLNDEVIRLTALYDGFEADVYVYSTDSGGRLATWIWNDTTYTLLTSKVFDDESISSVSLAIAALNHPAKPFIVVNDAGAFSDLGLEIEAPQDASNIEYGIAYGKIAEIKFLLNGHSFVFRAGKNIGWVRLCGVASKPIGAPVKNVLTINGSSLETEAVEFENGGKLTTWVWGDVRYAVFTQDEIGNESIVAVCSALAQATAPPPDFEIVDSSADFEAIGLKLSAPQGATDVEYAVRKGKIAQIEFQMFKMRFKFSCGKNLTWSEVCGVDEEIDYMGNAEIFPVSAGENETEVAIWPTVNGNRIVRWYWDYFYTVYFEGESNDDINALLAEMAKETAPEPQAPQSLKKIVPSGIVDRICRLKRPERFAAKQTEIC